MAIAFTTHDFSGLMRDVSRLLEIDVNTVHRKVAFDLFAGVVRKTPVDTGRARGSWRVGIGEMNSSVLPAGKGPDARAVESQGESALQSVTADKPVWITNSLPYIEALENGHSKQAPNGFVSLSIAEVKAGLTRLVG